MQKLIVEKWTDNLKKFDFIHSHLGFECDKCKVIPESIFVCWIRDFKKQRKYLRFFCFTCLEKLKKNDGYLDSYIDLLGVEFKATFPDIDPVKNKVLFIAKNFIMRENYEYTKKQL